MIILQNQWKTNACRHSQYFRKRPYVHTSWAERYTCLLKKNRFYKQHRNDYSIPRIFAIEAWKKMCFVELVFASRQLMEKMRNLILRSQCFNKIFSTKSKKEDTMYMGIVYMSFLSRNLRKNIYTMSSFIWSNELFSILKWGLCLLYFFI